MKGFKSYQGFCKEFIDLMWEQDTPCFGRNMNDFFVFLTPKEVREFRDCQYHADSKYEYPLWFIGDEIQKWIPDYASEEYEAYNDEQNRRDTIFRKKMAKLFRKYHIAPEGWIRWYAHLFD